MKLLEGLVYGVYSYNKFIRIGNLENVFIATDEQVKELIGKELQFDEPLGKYSSVSIMIEENDITKKDIAPDMIAVLAAQFGQSIAGNVDLIGTYEYMIEDGVF